MIDCTQKGSGNTHWCLFLVCLGHGYSDFSVTLFIQTLLFLPSMSTLWKLIPFESSQSFSGSYFVRSLTKHSKQNLNTAWWKWNERNLLKWLDVAKTVLHDISPTLPSSPSHVNLPSVSHVKYTALLLQLSTVCFQSLGCCSSQSLCTH